jgi:hypothetical protein
VGRSRLAQLINRQMGTAKEATEAVLSARFVSV